MTRSVLRSLELAPLDALACEGGQSVEAALGLPELAGSFQYTAVLGDSEPDAFERLLDLYRTTGVRDFKPKLSGDLGRDRVKLASFHDRPEERVLEAPGLGLSVVGAEECATGLLEATR